MSDAEEENNSVGEDSTEGDTSKAKFPIETVFDSKLPPGTWPWIVERFERAYDPGVSAHPPCKCFLLNLKKLLRFK